jgi:hypothetical protein
LYRFAGEETKGFDRVEALRELLRRPYWLNTARFYGGNAGVSDLSMLVDGIVEELSDDRPPHAVIAGWRCSPTASSPIARATPATSSRVSARTSTGRP